MKKLAIFGSGSGSNAENICNYFRDSNYVDIACIFTNNKEAFIVKRAKKLKIPIIYISKKKLLAFFGVYKTLKSYNIDYIILAGFLLKIPKKMINLYPKKIINIHPSLLPKYGGAGMYGRKVHQSVLENKESESGITIHFVNENYDEGEIIFQESCKISCKEKIIDLERKIGLLELKNFPKIIEKIIFK